MALKADCRHFPGDRPCQFNKEFGQLCDDCQHYSTVQERILLIKLAAAGDVLRTTSLLPSIKQKHPLSHLTWLTSRRSVPLLERNPNVDEIWSFEEHVPARLLAQEFDLVLNPDADKICAALASLARSNEKRGLLLDARGMLTCANPEAQHWLEMGAFDQFKKANQRTYADLISEMLQLPYERCRPTLCLTETEAAWGREFLQAHGWAPSVPLIGINLGGGTRWKKKVWKEHHFVKFAQMLLHETSAGILLVGGPFESERLRRVSQAIGNETGRIYLCKQEATDRETAALIACCHLLVTGDTLCLHLATALEIPVVLLIGPTSAAELDVFGLGEKIIAPIACTGCYLPDCEIDPDCMELINPEVVFAAMERTLAAHRGQVDDRGFTNGKQPEQR